MQLTPEKREEYLRQSAAARYRAGLSVETVPQSRVITISYSATDPEFAALAANTTAELYILDQLTSKERATAEASDFLSQRVRELRERVIAQEREIAHYRSEAGIIDAGGITIYQQQLARTNEELADAHTARAEAEARYEQVQELIERGSGLEVAAAVLDSDLIGNLRHQAEVIRKLAELETTLRADHPRLQLARASSKA